ncbi:MAG: helix-turn-helix domain-containing protein, partial [Pseudomonadota bacterium]
MTNQSANERLKYLLQQLALTQKEFADRLGISQGAISQLISGRTALSFDTLQKIGEQYRVNLN